ncbi:MAG: hypothetical protein NTZ55_05715 [Candidatus Roizmanbacteria bacterium]|nr:hypothetical protein [Candidatus Roizmanbacteria bacterium]
MGEFINNKKKAIEDMEEGKDLFIKMSGQKRYEEIINELEEINKEKIKMNPLVVHLKEKYKYDPAKIITILVDYADWLYATGHYYANRIHIHYVEDADSIFEENNENFLKAITIKERLSKLADKDVLKLLATTQKK